VANRLDGSVSRIDPRVNRVVETIATGAAPVAITADGERLWVAARARPPAGPRGGGTATVSLQGDLDSLDPAIAFTHESWQLLRATCGGLLNYLDRSGQEGARLVPELATALPRVSNGGRTYTFTIRRGVRFAPPSRETVTAATMAHSLERSLSPRLAPDTAGRGLLEDVVGAEAYATGKAKRVRGIVARGRELSVTLRAPNGDLPARLAVPTFCAVPSGVPPVAAPGAGPVPSTGPYVVTDHVPGERVVLERNPRYRGPRPHRLDRIEYVLGLGGERAVEQVLRGSVDYAADGLPPERERDLARRYGPGSPAARAGHQQFFERPYLQTDMLVLNTARPLFADRRLRQAVSYAIDRKAIASLPPYRQDSGVTTLEPTDQFLPPGMPGYTDAKIYPIDGPDVAAARRLAGDRPRRAVLYIWRGLYGRRVAEIVRRNLAAIRIKVTVRTRSVDEHFGRLFTRGEPFDIGYFGWIADYPDPGDFLPRLFDGSRIGLDANANASYFDDPAFNRRLAESAALPAPERYAAFGRIDHDLARAAPAVALYNRAQRSLFSKRIGCQVQHPAFGVDLAALCVRGR